MCRDIRFDGFGVHLLAPGRRDEAIARFVEEARSKYQVVLAIPLSDDFGPLSASKLRDTFADLAVYTIPNLHFAGLHPDLTYLGGLGRRVTGPVGDYHSKLAIFGYLKGMSVAEAEALFCDSAYSRLGYYDVYAQSLAELERRDQALDVPFAAELAQLLKEDLCFLSVNHPTGFLLSRFCDKAASRLEAEGISRKIPWPRCPGVFINLLAQSAIFPIYPEIARFHALPYEGSYIFKPPTIGDTPVTCLDKAEFISAEFENLRTTVPEALMKVRQVRDFQRQAEALLEAPSFAGATAAGGSHG
jgi:hypothetical protein